MSTSTFDRQELAEWDPELTRRLINAAGPLANRWFR